jgi:hypothetical protein
LLNGGTPVRHGLPLHIEMEYESSGDFEGIAFCLGFSSHEGGRIVSIDSDIPGDRFAVRRGTSGRAELRIEQFHLQPGRYVLDIAARSGENLSLDFLPGFASVEVLPGPDTPPVIIGRAESGSVRMPATCHHFPASSDVPLAIS